MAATTPPKNITVVGSLNMDLRTVTTRMPKRGETLTSTSFSTGPGGKGANQAVAYARLSQRGRTNNQSPTSPSAQVNVKMVGAVGDDTFGHDLLKFLEKDQVDVRGVRVDRAATTGTAIVIVEQGSGENCILVHGGANAGVGVDCDLERVLGEVFGSDNGDEGKLPDLIIMQCEIPLKTVLAVIREARKRNVKVLWNPAPAPAPTEEVGGDGRSAVIEALNGLEHLVLNEDEAFALADAIATPGSIYRKSANDLDSRREALQRDIARHFIKLGVRNIIITLGAEGALWGGKRECNDKNGTVHKLPATKVERILDTTAAGDTFVGAYAVGVVRDTPAMEAIRWANRAAAKTVEKEGAMRSIPSRKEVDG